MNIKIKVITLSSIAIKELFLKHDLKYYLKFIFTNMQLLKNSLSSYYSRHFSHFPGFDFWTLSLRNRIIFIWLAEYVSVKGNLKENENLSSDTFYFC